MRFLPTLGSTMLAAVALLGTTGAFAGTPAAPPPDTLGLCGLSIMGYVVFWLRLRRLRRRA